MSAVQEKRLAAEIKKVISKGDTAKKLMIGSAQFKIECAEELDDFHIEKAERELRETPELREESMKTLIQMLSEETDLYAPLEEEYLSRFLRRCKWYPKSAFKLIKRHFEYKKTHPELFENLLPSNERAALVSGVIIPLPRRNNDGCRVVIVQGGKMWKPKEVSLNQVFKTLLMIFEIAVSEVRTQVSGVKVIIDMEGLSLSQITYFTPSFAASVIDYLQKALPGRLKGVHIINQSFLFDMVFAFFKPFIQGKLRQRIFFHGSKKSSLLEHFDPKCIPKKFGGEFEVDIYKPVGEPLYNYALEFEDYLKEMNRYGYSKNE